MENVLDREKLLLALRGQCISEKTLNPAWVQELSLHDASQVSSLCIEGFEPISIPIPKQEIRKLKPRAKRVPGAEGIWCFEGKEVKLQSRPPFTATQFDENLKSTLMKNAVLQLGLEPDYHCHSIEPYQLLIYDSGSRNYSHTHHFEQKQGVFGLLMLQIPVEGGHGGGDLIVRHGLEDIELERSCDTSVAVPRGMSFPKFFSSLNTVKQISSPLNSATEDCDTELLVIPLLNDYARIPLSYGNLIGSDQLVASLLQSTNFLEVRLATIANYRAGTAYNERRMNIDRAVNDDGYPDSPRQLELEPSQSNSKRRFVTEVFEKSCSIKEIFLLNGQVETSENSFPIVWNRDYIFNNIESAEDLFDEVSPPDKEEYDRYHTPANGLELKQWWYKPVLVAYPKDSVVLECRKNLYHVAYYLNDSVDKSKLDLRLTVDHQSHLIQLKKIVNYLNRQKPTGAEEEDGDFETFLDICISLKAKEEGINIFRLYASFFNIDWLCLVPKIAVFIGFTGWPAFVKFFPTIISKLENEKEQLNFQIELLWELLKEDSDLHNEAAVIVYRKLFTVIFNSEGIPTRDNFVNRSNWLLELDGNDTFFVSVFLLERRHLLDDAENLIPMVTHFIAISPDFFINFLDHFVSSLCSSLLIKSYSLHQMHEELQKLLSHLCKRFLQLNGTLTTHPAALVSWIQLFVFAGDRPMVQQLTDNICSFPSHSVSLEMTDEQFFREILADQDFANEPKFKTIRSQLRRRLNILLKRSLYEVRRSASQLKIDCSRLRAPLNLVIGASTSVVDLHQLRQLRASQLCDVVRPINSRIGLKFSKEEMEEEFIGFCDLLNVCNNLRQKLMALRILNRFLATKCFDSKFFIRPELLTAMAAFLTHAGEKCFGEIIDSIRTRYIGSEEGGELSFEIHLAYNLLKLNKSSCNYAAENIFKKICFQKNSYSKMKQCISLISHHHQHVFFCVVLLIETRYLLRYDTNIFVPLSECLAKSPISVINSFLEMFFTDLSLTQVPYTQLMPGAKKLLGYLCRHGPFHIYHSPQVPILEPIQVHLLNWFRLSLYVNESWHISTLLSHLCFESGDNYASLRQLLANEDFQTQPRYKNVREHKVLLKWKKRMQKEAFYKLFIRQSSAAIKRKLPATHSIDEKNPKRAQVSHPND